MQQFMRPRLLILLLMVAAILGLTTWAVNEFLLWSTPQQTPPADRSKASSAAIITQRGRLRVGVRQDVKPFGFIDENGQFTGFDIDIAREFARRWLGNANAVDLVVVSAADRIPRLAAGDVDMLLAAMPQKREREAFIDFSQPYFLDGQTLLVRDNGGIQALGDLANKTVAGIQGAQAIDTLQQIASQRNIPIQLLAYPAYPQALAALQSGQIDAITADSVTLSQFAKDVVGLRLVGGRFTQEYYGIGVPQGDSDFRKMVNFTLQDMKRDGTYDSLYKHWFPADEPLNVEVSPGNWSFTLNQLPAKPVVITPSRIEEILQRGHLIAAVHQDFHPFSTLDNTGQRVGFDLDIVKEFARRWLGDENAIEIVADTPEMQIERLVSGQVDLVAAALVQQREWAAQIDFSQTYLGDPVVSLPLSIGLPQNDPSFRELINVTLQEMKVDGAYDAIFQRWFGESGKVYDLQVIPGDAGYLLAALSNQNNAPRVTAARESTIERVRQRSNLLRVGVQPNAAPFTFLAEDGKFGGFDVELIQAMAQEWSVSLEFMGVASGEGPRKLLTGEIDMLASGLPRTKEGEKEIDFSQSYFLNGIRLLAKRTTGIQNLRSLNERTVAVLEGSNIADQVQALAEASGITVTLQPQTSVEAALTALQNDKVAAMVADEVTVALLAKENSDLSVSGGLLNPIPFGFGLPSGDSYFNNLVNSALQRLKQTGVYDQLYHKWFGDEATPYAVEIFPGQWAYTFAQSPTKLDLPVRSKVEEILNRKKIVAGVLFDYPPFGFLDANSQSAGFDVDIIREMGSRWLGDANAVEFVPVTFANGAEKLAAGEVDIVASALVHQQERDELIDFSQTYYRGEQALLVQNDAPIQSISALNNKVVAVIQGSGSTEHVQYLVNSQGINLSILPFQEFGPALEALKAKQVFGITGVRSALEQFAGANPGFAVVAGIFGEEPYGLGIPNYDGRFQDLVNFTLQSMKQDGVYDRLYEKWFGSTPYAIEVWPGNSYFDLDLTPMVHIPAGEFTRGNQAGFPDERIEQQIYLDEFYIDQYEVTNRQYEACVQAGRCSLPRLPRSVNFANYYAGSSYGNYPVIWLTWNDATDYCAFRGKRLPTEAEWEKAARGLQNTIYPWGNDEPTTQTNFNYIARDVAPTGSFPGDVSGYGVYDMAGNVREWVADWYQWDFYAASPPQNPTGPSAGVTKVLRGGSWNDIAIYVRATSRKNFLPDSFDSNLGFRCASSTFPPSR